MYLSPKYTLYNISKMKRFFLKRSLNNLQISRRTWIIFLLMMLIGYFGRSKIRRFFRLYPIRGTFLHYHCPRPLSLPPRFNWIFDKSQEDFDYHYVPLVRQRYPNAGQDNSEDEKYPGLEPVPNIIHFVHFKKPEYYDIWDLNTVEFVCIVAAFFVQNPKTIVLHSNIPIEKLMKEPRIKRLSDVFGSKFEMVHVKMPQFFGAEPLEEIDRREDLFKLKRLAAEGGIFLNKDVYLVQDLHNYRVFETTFSWPADRNVTDNPENSGQNGQVNYEMDTEVLMAKKNARFIQEWRKIVKGTGYDLQVSWRENFADGPTRIMRRKCHRLYHRVFKQMHLGKDISNTHYQNMSHLLFQGNWKEWKEGPYKAIQLANAKHFLRKGVLRGDDDSPVNPNTTFGSMHNWAMDQLRIYASKRKELRAKEEFEDNLRTRNYNNKDYNKRDNLSLK